jgi:hypothetical protein
LPLYLVPDQAIFDKGILLIELDQALKVSILLQEESFEESDEGVAFLFLLKLLGLPRDGINDDQG